MTKGKLRRTVTISLAAIPVLLMLKLADPAFYVDTRYQSGNYELANGAGAVFVNAGGTFVQEKDILVNRYYSASPTYLLITTLPSAGHELTISEVIVTQDRQTRAFNLGSKNFAKLRNERLGSVYKLNEGFEFGNDFEIEVTANSCRVNSNECVASVLKETVKFVEVEKGFTFALIDGWSGI